MTTLVELAELFDVRYGVNLELNALEQNENGINFVSRTARNNGVSARVTRIDGVEPIPAGTISVAGGGSVMASFLQPSAYYSGRDLYYLKARIKLTDQEKLFYCNCLWANKYRFNYGRQANRTLAKLMVPAPSEIPDWVNNAVIPDFSGYKASATPRIKLSTHRTWQHYRLDELFEIKKGKRLTKAKMRPGSTPFIGAIASNNGVRQLISANPQHDGNTITVNYNGSVAEAFYQPEPFTASDDVNVLYPLFSMTPAIGLFIATIIRFEKYRFNYGRKWHLNRMREATIALPTVRQAPDWNYMERFVNGLPYSARIA